jgi:hypothetical protein
LELEFKISHFQEAMFQSTKEIARTAHELDFIDLVNPNV